MSVSIFDPEVAIEPEEVSDLEDQMHRLFHQFITHAIMGIEVEAWGQRKCEWCDVKPMYDTYLEYIRRVTSQGIKDEVLFSWVANVNGLTRKMSFQVIERLFQVMLDMACALPRDAYADCHDLEVLMQQAAKDIEALYVTNFEPIDGEVQALVT